MGRIPIFLYDDLPWVPYNGTLFSVENFGFLGGLNHPEHDITKILQDIKSMPDKIYHQKLHYLKHARYFYTYDGVFQQIYYFMQAPFNNSMSLLRCQPYPRTERCCDKKYPFE